MSHWALESGPLVYHGAPTFSEVDTVVVRVSVKGTCKHSCGSIVAGRRGRRVMKGEGDGGSVCGGGVWVVWKKWWAGRRVGGEI